MSLLRERATGGWGILIYGHEHFYNHALMDTFDERWVDRETAKKDEEEAKLDGKGPNDGGGEITGDN